MRLLQLWPGYDSYRRLRNRGVFSASPPMVLAGGFAVLILIGTVLLCLPFAANKPLGFFTALFTATSAVTVTGLSILGPNEYLLPFGHTVVAALVQVGGLGFVTLTVVAALTLGKKVSLQYQTVALEAFDQTSVSKIRSTAFLVFKLSAAIEIMGILILTAWWTPVSGFLNALPEAVFHTVMAFNNGGMSLPATNMAHHLGDPITVLATTALIILGGLGFSVINDVRRKRQWALLAPYTRVILLATLLLNISGFMLIWAFEAGNPDTLGGLSGHAQALTAWLQSVASRTAGFHSLDLVYLRDETTLVLMLLMFIGGGSLSTASGIKVGTFVVLLVAAWSYIRGRREVVLLRRTVSPDVVQKSLALLLVTGALAFMATLIMCFIEKAHFIDVLFEVISALSTTGATRNLTPGLSAPSHVLLIVLMFVGRVGPLTLIYSLSTQGYSRVRHPEAHFHVG
ncbi:MAG TPA: potassium transporter TrkG [Pusillimonas sp.]|uniref:TrkH family potassium uptake protein n=1 Tax=unclassified Pusillimonas TaxID=2640016 RepID=UPI002630EADD|nr:MULTISPECIES: potassium transporter TrkG [unclassified Pusillimonas]HLU18748.1 potassium transporter TrkG [Pusillimonas sp.]